MNKVFESFDRAVADVPDGAVIMLTSFAGPGPWPQRLILALRNQGAKNLTIIASNTGNRAYPEQGPDEVFADMGILVKNGQVKKAISSYFVGYSMRPQPFEQAYLAGEVEAEAVPLGNLVERIRAAGAGIGGFYTPVGVNTSYAQGKEVRGINGVDYILEFPLKADYAFIRANKADEMGNLIYRGTSRALGPIMATAADTVIAEVDEIVKTGAIDPDIVITPGIYIDRIVKITEPGIYPRGNNDHL